MYYVENVFYCDRKWKTLPSTEYIRISTWKCVANEIQVGEVCEKWQLYAQLLMHMCWRVPLGVSSVALQAISYLSDKMHPFPSLLSSPILSQKQSGLLELKASSKGRELLGITNLATKVSTFGFYTGLLQITWQISIKYVIWAWLQARHLSCLKKFAHWTFKIFTIQDTTFWDVTVVPTEKELKRTNSLLWMIEFGHIICIKPVYWVESNVPTLCISVQLIITWYF